MKKIHQFFEEQVALHPNRIAVSDSDLRLTYKELNERSSRLAHCLTSRYQLGSGDMVPISVSSKTADIMAVVLAVLKCGAAYVVLNHKNPVDLNREILNSLKPKVVFLSSDLQDYATTTRTTIIDVNDIDKVLSDISADQYVTSRGESDLAYVVYTSGTTGAPKGVMVCHNNLVAALYSWKSAYKLSLKDTHLQMANYAFDVFTSDWVRALCTGGRLVMCPNAVILQPKKLYRLIHDEKVNCAEFVPAILGRLQQYLEDKELDLNVFRLLICGSDQWPITEYKKAQRIFSKARVINSYGLTETTIDSTYFETLSEQEQKLTSPLVPIGKPFPHVKIYILNEEGVKVRPGELGEIYVGGTGVAAGYLNQPELTAERFLRDPFATSTKARMYKTGDLAYFLADENIVFLGRNQFQVNINGERVELCAVEAALTAYTGISGALVLPDPEFDRSTKLSAYIVVNDKSKIDYDELTTYLSSRLPPYSIPRQYYLVDKIALNLNNKISRNVADQKIIGTIKPKVVRANSSMEQELIFLWRDILKSGQVDLGVTQDFFNLGGTSLEFITMIERVNAQFGLSLESNCQTRTIRQIALHVRDAQFKAMIEKISDIENSKFYFPLQASQKAPHFFPQQKEIIPRRQYSIPKISVKRRFPVTARRRSYTTLSSNVRPLKWVGYGHIRMFASRSRLSRNKIFGSVAAAAVVSSYFFKRNSL